MTGLYIINGRTGDKLQYMKNLKANLKKYYLELIVIGIYAISYIVISCFHEPWFDECEAWQIARCASIKDILFTIPHYEGHPALWHLILLIPAKLGFPFEISLKTIGFIFCTAAVILFEFYAPFKRWVKAMIPFTFFFFYQYGISVRPYCVMMFLFMLLSILFKKKDSKPFAFIICLIFLCLCSAYCIVIAAGIALAWLIDIISELKWSGFFKKIFRDKRILSLWLLLVCALLMVWQIFPKSSTMGTNLDEGNSFFERLLATVFTFIPDSFITENGWTGCEVLLQYASFDTLPFVTTILIGILMIGMIWLFSRKGMFKYYILPHLVLSVFSAAVYFQSHHLGVFYFVILFWGWVNYTSDNGEYRFVTLFNKCKAHDKIVSFYGKYKKSLNVLFLLVEFVLVFISVLWSIQSSIYDIQNQYSYGRDLASFIKENNLENLLYVAEWKVGKQEFSASETDTNYVNIPTNIYPYFDSNFVINSTEGYVNHIVPTDEENAENIAKWGTYGVPDIALGYVDIAALTDGEYTLADYSPIYEMQFNYIWKGYVQEANNFVFMRNDLLEKYGLTSLRDEYMKKLNAEDVSE